jgi:gliding motility-associated lipoprotein GldH
MDNSMLKKKYSSFVLVFLLLGLISCNSNRLFDEVQKIPARGWESNESKKFTISVNDTNVVYDIFLHLRSKSTYDYSNLWMFIKTSAPNNQKITDTVEFFLADASGKKLGKGLGSVNSMLIPYKKNIKFPYRGIYVFEFQQAMRQDVLEGILDIGMRVQPHH